MTALEIEQAIEQVYLESLEALKSLKRDSDTEKS
jgi:hypothetical protein